MRVPTATVASYGIYAIACVWRVLERNMLRGLTTHQADQSHVCGCAPAHRLIAVVCDIVSSRHGESSIQRQHRMLSNEPLDYSTQLMPASTHSVTPGKDRLHTPMSLSAFIRCCDNACRSTVKFNYSRYLRGA
jgi:hypothetical protein